MPRILLAGAAMLFAGLIACTPIGGTTPLIDAARAGDTAAMEMLLKAGANPDQPAGVNNWTPLLHAIHKGRRESVRVLIQYGAKVNLEAGGTTPLIMAAGYGYAGIVKLLLASGADPMERDRDGYTALSAAVGGVPDHDRFTVGHCQTDTVKELLDRAPQLRLRNTLGDETAVRVAKFAGCREVVRMVRFEE